MTEQRIWYERYNGQACVCAMSHPFNAHPIGLLTEYVVWRGSRAFQVTCAEHLEATLQLMQRRVASYERVTIGGVF